MEKGTIILNGVSYGCCYCYATEIDFRKFAGENIDNMDAGNPEHITYMILSSVMSYYKGKGEECPLTSDTLIYETQPNELVEAAKTIIRLRKDWYELPKGEPQENREEDDGKNVLAPTTSIS